MRPWLNRVVMCALAVILSGPPPALAASEEALALFFDQSFGNLREELETARAEGKQGLFIMFDDPDCPWCHKMKTTVLSQPRVRDYYRRYFRTLRIDTRGDTLLTDFEGREMAEKEFAAKVHRVRATPVFLFVGLDGQVLFRYTGQTRDAEEFLWLAEYVVSGAYRDKNYTVYKRERLAATIRPTP
jgi:thioredoxin-related protein